MLLDGTNSPEKHGVKADLAIFQKRNVEPFEKAPRKINQMCNSSRYIRKNRGLKTELSDTYLVTGERAQGQLNRRSKMETYCEIVKAVGAGAQRPTHIMYKANLSWSVMQDYVKNLESNGIVASAVVEGKRVYQLTQKGFTLLNKYLSIREDLSFAEGRQQPIILAQTFGY